MYIESVPNRNSPPAILLRESYRDRGKVRKRTLANLSKWPPALIEGLRTLLKGGRAIAHPPDAFDIVRSQPHGHVAAVLGTLQQLRLDRLIGPRDRPERPRVLALIIARILHPGSKLATARGLTGARTSLADTLGLGALNEDDLYAAMDWLLTRQDRIERTLADRHLKDGALVLYDLTSVYLEGQACPLARRGYSREGKRGKLQIEFGLLCDGEGCPVAVKVFDGDTADPLTVGAQITKLKERFGLARVVLVGDRGMLTEARVREEVQPAGLDWISALRSSAIRQLVEAGTIQLSLFDEQDLVEVRSDVYPGERLMVCRNPLLADQRARKREDLLAATEALLAPVAAATQRAQRRLQGQDRIGVKVGKVINQYKMAKHFDLTITDESFTYRRKAESIAAEAALDGLYVVRTSLGEDDLSAADTVRAYKRLSRVERAFRSLKSVDLKVRPVFHYNADRVRAHVLLCMLAYYVEWHMRRRLKPLLFDDEDPGAAEAARRSVVAPARVSDSARAKARRKHTAEGFPVHSFRTLLDDLATLCRNRVVAKVAGAEPFEMLTQPTPLQQEAFKLLGVRV
ncbi:MAG: IS1634 family transposase [Gammaproteobacteria bacterium]|nr:IS1634 family transposase [Gammaproteobacteria bacterium]